jgi:isopenicillin N synthase-like dioxygenase
MNFSAIPIEDSQANNGIYTAKHTDLRGLTLSFRQPVAGLQILDGNEWKLVKPYEDTVLVNCEDALSGMTGGYFKSGVHRIHAPPKDQIDLDRFVVLLFSTYTSITFRNE